MSLSDNQPTTPAGLQSTKALLTQRGFSRNFKRVKSENSRTAKYRYEFQFFGDRLTRELDDESKRSWYMKLAKNENRALLEAALRFVKGAKVRNKGAVFTSRFYKLKKAAEAHKLVNSGGVGKQPK